MNWQCPGCGKRVEFSDEQLNETQGVVVCPQCLSGDTIPGYAAAKPRRRPPSAPPPAMPEPTSAPSPAAPPPHRKKRAASRQPAHGETPAPAARPPERKKKSTAASGKRKKSRRQGRLAPMSAWGCLWRSAAWTLALLAAYIIVGALLQGV